MTFEHYILLGVFVLASISAFRIAIGPSVWDRLLGLNLVASKLVMMIVLVACIKASAFLLDVALIYALLGFIGVTFMAKMMVSRHHP